MICSRKEDDGRMNGGWCEWEFDWCVSGIRGTCSVCKSEFDVKWDRVDIMEDEEE